VEGTAVSPSWPNSYVNQWQFLKSKEFEPSIVVIMLGTNDAHTQQFASNFAYEYQKLVSEYQELPNNPRILLVKPPPIYDNELELSDTNLDGYVIPGIEKVANELGLSTVDVNGALANRPEFFEDGVHPNSAGALAIATEIIEAINFEN
jgi:acyl-CoA thioesterase-1